MKNVIESGAHMIRHTTLWITFDKGYKCDVICKI